MKTNKTTTRASESLHSHYYDMTPQGCNGGVESIYDLTDTQSASTIEGRITSKKIAADDSKIAADDER